MELRALFLANGYRNRGIGSKLMNNVEDLGRGLDAKSIWLTSNPTESSVMFYLAKGFQPISLNTNKLVHHKPGDPIFAKQLGD